MTSSLFSVVPATNATLTSVAGGGTTEDYDQPAGTDTTRWTGSTGIYVVEELLTQLRDGSSVDELNHTRLYLPLDVGGVVQRGDTLTYDRGGTQTRIARTVAVHDFVGLAVVTLEDQ